MAATVAGRVLRTALPNYVGQAIACAATFGLALAVVALVPGEVVPWLLLVLCVQWTSALGACGLPTGLLRLYPVRPDERRDLLVTSWLGVALVSSAIVATIQFTPGLTRLLLGDDAGEHVAPFLWTAPAVAVIAVGVEAMHATNSLRRKAALEAASGVLPAAAGVAGCLLTGFHGLLWGAFLAAAVLAATLRPRAAGGFFRARSFIDLFRVGRWHALFLALEALRTFLVLRIAASLSAPGETAVLAVAIAVTLPLVSMPEIRAQAVFPATIGAGGGGPGLGRVRRRLLVELGGVSLIVLAAVAAAAVRFLSDATVLLALLPGIAVHSLVSYSGAAVLTRDRMPVATLASFASVVVAAALAVWLVPVLGPVGAAVALSASLVARAVLVALAVRAASRAISRPGPDAPTSLDAVRATADTASFPKQVLAGAPTVLSLFSAAFHGRNDCIHLADGGVTDALLVDLDDEKLSEMRAIYPSTWRYAAGDAYVVAESLRAAGETFDLVVVDGWTGEAERMLTRNFPLWCALSRRHTVLMASKPWFDAQRIEPTPAAVQAWVKERHGLEVTVEELHFRADWVGGVWWIVVRT